MKRKVVWRDSFWMPDEAASVYARAAAIVSMECHSPIIALTVGTPALHIRQPTDTCKAEMFRDVGVGEWLGEIGEAKTDEWWSRIEAIQRDPAAARRKVEAAMARVRELQQRMAGSLGRLLAAV